MHFIILIVSHLLDYLDYDRCLYFNYKLLFIIYLIYIYIYYFKTYFLLLLIYLCIYFILHTLVLIGRASPAHENEAGGRKSIFSMLTYRTSFCFWL